VTDNDKHAGLLQKGATYDFVMFYSTVPRSRYSQNFHKLLIINFKLGLPNGDTG